MSFNLKMLIPELSDRDLHEVILKNILLANLLPEQYRDLIFLVFKKVEGFYQHQYYEKGDLDSQASQVMVWMGGLSDLTTRQLFGGLIACLSGKTRYVDKPPPNVIAFHQVCKEHSFPAYYFEPVPELEDIVTDEKRAKSLAVAEHRLKLAREMLGKTFIRVNPEK